MDKYKILIGFLIVVTIIGIGIIGGFFLLNSKTEIYTNENTERFVIPLNTMSEDVVNSLYEKDFIKHKKIFSFLWSIKNGKDFTSGGYRISKEMGMFMIIKTLQKEPYLKWVVIPEGLRKEEIAEILAEKLNWAEEEKQNWITVDTIIPNYTEGVYFPDTYLIPVDEKPSDVAKRLIARFNEHFASYFLSFNQQNIKWTTGLTLASIIQREASGSDDMPLIAGILWNRLEENMYLNVDATLQYMRGNTGEGWWKPISSGDKKIDSPFNTYKYKGLPPHPISNPGISAIEAVLNPTITDCVYYLHDNDGQIHCTKTYEEHKENIEKYLK